MSSAHDSTASAKHPNGLPAMNDANAKTKHLSQPYNMHSISTESLPALFGASSLRRTNSNVVSKTRASRGTSPAPNSSCLSNPPSPAASHTAPQRTSPHAQSTTPAGAAAAPARRPPIHAIPEHFELDSSHRRRPSSWDIMDMLAIEQLRQWMVCFCVVNFDLEKGQGKFSVLDSQNDRHLTVYTQTQ